jgi:hypothetical protein
MSTLGQTYPEFTDVLAEDAPCLIIVDSVNSPTGIWHGTVIKQVDNRFSAAINGGFVIIQHALIETKEHVGTIPNVNYTVIPDTKFTREYVHDKLLHKQAQLKSLEKIKTIEHTIGLFKVTANTKKT